MLKELNQSSSFLLEPDEIQPDYSTIMKEDFELNNTTVEMPKPQTEESKTPEGY
jgi:hypothetical protein